MRRSGPPTRVDEKRDESRGQMKGYSNGSPVTASYSSRCCSSSCDRGQDVQLVTAPPRPPGGHKMVHVCRRKKWVSVGEASTNLQGCWTHVSMKGTAPLS